MNIFNHKYSLFSMDYNDQIKELFEDSSENNSEHCSEQSSEHNNDKDSLLSDEKQKIYKYKNHDHNHDHSHDQIEIEKYSSKHEYTSAHHYIYSEDYHVKRNRLYIIQNFNPSIYFLNEHVLYAKNKNQKLLITNIGKYSITKPLQGKWMKSIMIDFFKQKKLNTKFCTIIDAFAGIGGDSIFFSKYFQHVHAIEKNQTHFEVLKNNIEVLDLTNVHLYMGNFMHIIQQAKLIFLLELRLLFKYYYSNFTKNDN
jgi:tRNA/tmRNA/rRNA uracil-C5-methylase (TrmA/RlmC/RlmD family)